VGPFHGWTDEPKRKISELLLGNQALGSVAGLPVPTSHPSLKGYSRKGLLRVGERLLTAGTLSKERGR
jgi:hypothetical protein